MQGPVHDGAFHFKPDIWFIMAFSFPYMVFMKNPG